MRFRKAATVTAVFIVSAAVAGFSAEPGWKILSGHVPAALAHLTPSSLEPATNKISLAIGLPLRNQDQLDELIQQLYDPRSTHFHQFLTPQEFTARFGPTEEDYQAVIHFAEKNGLTISGRHSNRVVLDVTGTAANIERAFQVTLRTYRHPTEPRNFFAPDTEPSVPTNLPVADMWGLSDYALPRPLVHKADPSQATPLNSNGSGPGGAYQGGDFRNAYIPDSTLNGAGQTVALAEFDGYYQNDITNYEVECGYTNLPFVPLQNVLLNNVSGSPGYSGISDAVVEVSLDIEMAIAMAPGLSKLVVYEGSSAYDVFNRIATDDLAKQISCSWTWSVGPSRNWLRGHGVSTLDSILSQMVAQGQAFFQASGDNDAYTGSQALSSSSGPIPADSIYVTSVGGTSLNMDGTGGSWSSETTWNWGGNIGSGGGISPNYNIPSWQASISMAANSGSSVKRNIPDVALTADAINVLYNNGTLGTYAGTSCAAPLWAGFCALANQLSFATNGTTLGFLNPTLYAIAESSCYVNCFHDITTGNNIGDYTPGLFYATNGYDLCTGLGTPNGTNLINALVWPPPSILTQPISRNVTNGANVAFNVMVGGTLPLSYSWLFNGTNLTDGGNIYGSASNVLSVALVTTDNAGNYQLVASNSTGVATSSVAVLNVGDVPVFLTQPANLMALSGSSAIFSATTDGSMPLFYQWRKNAVNLTNGAAISGATSNIITLANVATNNSGNYNLFATNIFGAAISSNAVLTVVVPPAIASSSLTNRTIQCGNNIVTFAITAIGTLPLNIQWSLDAAPIIGATNTSFSVTNLQFSNHNISVVMTNLYGSLASNAVLTVQDTIGPAITLNGANPFYIEFGNAFTDLGATAIDACAGVVPVTVSGSVNTSSVGTNTLTYTANDGNGNINTITRTVVVRDTTPPAILWSFTNLVLSADSNCSAPMPDVTGTNCILATDLSEPLFISQYPTNGTVLLLGTNLVVVTVTDVYNNQSYSTNTTVVQDQTPPAISGQPRNQTNNAGEAANFSVAATACTPLAFQWYFGNSTIVAQTNDALTLANINLALAGNYSVVVTASGGSSTSELATLTVKLAAPGVELASSENPSGYRDNINFATAIAPASASGTIQFYTNGSAFDLETLSAGQTASTSLASLSRGTNLVTAVYSGDAYFLPATNLLAQIVTNHPPAAAPAFYTNGPDGTLEISIADLATNWSDADGDPVSLVAVGISADGITVTNDGMELIYFNPENAADQFICTIADGFGGTNFQSINISPAPLPDTSPGIIGVAGGSDGGMTLNLSGASGYTYILETTTNLFPPISWLPVATNKLGTNGVWQFNDAQTTNFLQRFYRLKLSQ